MQERRQHVRYPSLLGGRIAFNRLSSTITCVVRNISPGGGRIVFDAPVAAPREFEVFIPHRQETKRARVIWRGKQEIGVEFVAPEQRDTVVSLDRVRQLKRLEADKEALKRRVEELTGG